MDTESISIAALGELVTTHLIMDGCTELADIPIVRRSMVAYRRSLIATNGVTLARPKQRTKPKGRRAPSASSPDLLTLDDVAQTLGVSRRSVSNLTSARSAGRLRTVRIGRLVRVTHADLNDYIKRKRG